MSSADLFLRLLEEKDIVSREVLQAARREAQRSSPPSDAVRLSLWLVQNQHLTAAQADRLLSAVAEKAEIPGPKPPAPEAGGAPAQRVGEQGARSKERGTGSKEQGVGARGLGGGGQPKSSQPQRPAASPTDDLELAPLEEEQDRPARPRAASPSSPPASPSASGQGKKSPGTGTPAGGQGKKSPTAARPDKTREAKGPVAAGIGDELESLEDTMRGPLDSLIESEGLAAAGFEDHTAGPQLNRAAPKKFKLRRFLKNLFRRDKSPKSDVVIIKPADRKQVRAVWLLLICLAGATALVVAALTLFRALSQPGTADLRRKVDAAGTAGDDSGTKAACDEFLKYYPDLDQADDVRWWKCLAELNLAEKQAAGGGERVLFSEAGEKQFQALPKSHANSPVMKKLADTLAKIGEDLAKKVKNQPDETSVDHLEMVVRMLKSEVFNDNRPTEALSRMKDSLEKGQKVVEDTKELKRTAEEIGSDVRKDDLPAAYACYRTLVQAHPDLSEDARLTDAMKEVSAAVQKAVKPVPQALAATREERPSGLLAVMPLAVQPMKHALAEGPKKVVLVVEQGTAYGLDAATGKVLWRRFVALDAKSPAVTVLPVIGPAAGDFVLCDPVNRELLCVRGATGGLVWRLAVKSPIVAGPVPAGKWLLLLTENPHLPTKDQRLPTKDNRLLMIDAATGDSPRYFQLPQAVRLPPVVDTVHGLIFLVADASNLIVLDGRLPSPRPWVHGARPLPEGEGRKTPSPTAGLPEGEGSGCCRQVWHVGHEAGMIAAPPAVVGDFLLLPVNLLLPVKDVPGKAAIRVLAISKDTKGEPLRAVQMIGVEGTLDSTPVAVENGAGVVTAQGGLFALERNGAAFRDVLVNGEPLEPMAARYVVSGGGGFWVADRYMTQCAVEVRTNPHQVTQTRSDLGMRFSRPPVIDGGTMVQVLQRFETSGRQEMPGVTVSVFDLAKHEAVWQTWLAAPLAGELAVGADANKNSGQLITAVTASGGVFRAALDGLKPGCPPWEPLAAIDASMLAKPLRSLLPLPGGMYALTGGADTRDIWLYDPKVGDEPFHFMQCERAMSIAPAAFAGGLLAACENGQVFLLGPESRKDLAKRLEPLVEGSKTWEWQAPVAVDNKAAVLCDGDRRLIVVRIGGDGEKALVKAAERVTQHKLVSPVAVLGKFVFVADSTAATDTLLSFQLPDLTPGKSQLLGSYCAWGPQRVGNLVLVASEKGRLLAIDERQDLVWESALGQRRLAGPPCVSGGEIFLSARNGTVWRISASDGKELGTAIDAGCPLGTGPLVVDQRVFVGGHDGSLLEVKRP